MTEMVTVERVDDFRPYDMIEEGRTIIELRFGGRGHGMTTGTVRARHERYNDMCVKHPDIADTREEPFPEFPVVVMRPGPIPDLPCPWCSDDKASQGEA